MKQLVRSKGRPGLLYGMNLAAFMLALVIMSGCTTMLGNASEKRLCTLDEVVAKLAHHDVAGQVVDKQGKPLPGADVFVYYARGGSGMRDRLAGRTKTGGDGRFRLEKAIVWEPVTESNGQRGSSYAVFAYHPTQGINFALLKEGDSSDGLSITLGGMTHATRSVVDGEGKPVAGARVFLASCTEELFGTPGRYPQRAGLNRDIGLSSGLTDGDGKVNLPAVGECTFRAEKEGYAVGWQRQYEPDVPIVLNPSAQVSGILTDPRDKPVAGAAIFYKYQSKAAQVSGVTLTGPDGRFCIKDAPCSGYHYSWTKQKDDQGKLTLTADDLRPGSPYVADPATFTIEPGQKQEKLLKLKRGVVLAGTVVDISTGEPVSGMRLEPIIGHSPLAERNTDERGAFHMKFQPGNEVTLSWQQSSGGRTIMDSDWVSLGNWNAFSGILDEDRTDLRLRVKRWQISPLHGRVVDAQGRGVRGAEVYLHPEVTPVHTGDDGSFRLEAGPDDRDFEMYAATDDGVQAGVARFKAGDKNVVIPIAAARTYQGQVVNTSGEPGGNLQFTLSPLVNEFELYQLQQNAGAGADGTFTTPPLCPNGRYRARWESNQDVNRDYSNGFDDIDLGQIKPDGVVRLVASRYINALMGKVVDEKGNPVGGARFQVEPPDIIAREARSELDPSAKDGEFTIGRLAEGEATVIASAAGYKSRALRTPTDAIDRVITLRPQIAPTTCRVTVVDESRKPVAGAPVTLRLAIKSADRATTSMQVLKTDAQGVCEFSWPALDPKAAGEGLVGVDLPGQAWAFAGVDPSRDEDLLLIARPVSKHPRGRIVDLAAKPVAGARLKLLWLNRDSAPTETRNANARAHVGEFMDLSVQTDQSGRYEWPRLGAADQFAMEVTAPGLAARQIGRWREPSVEDCFLLVPCGKLRARLVLRPTGGPLQGGTVYLRSEQDRLEEPGKPYPLGKDGMLIADDLLPTYYSIKSATSDGRRYACSPPGLFRVESGETTTVRQDVEESILFRGRLIDQKTGQPPKGQAWLTLKMAGGLQSTDGTFSDAEGRFQFQVPEGKFDISYMIAGMSSPQNIEVTVNRDKAGEEQALRVNIE